MDEDEANVVKKQLDEIDECIDRASECVEGYGDQMKISDITKTIEENIANAEEQSESSWYQCDYVVRFIFEKNSWRYVVKSEGSYSHDGQYTIKIQKQVEDKTILSPIFGANLKWQTFIKLDHETLTEEEIEQLKKIFKVEVKRREITSREENRKNLDIIA